MNEDNCGPCLMSDLPFWAASPDGVLVGQSAIVHLNDLRRSQVLRGKSDAILATKLLQLTCTSEQEFPREFPAENC